MSEPLELKEEEAQALEDLAASLEATILGSVPARMVGDMGAAEGWRLILCAHLMAGAMAQLMKTARSGGMPAEMVDPVTIQLAFQTVFDALSERMQEAPKGALN